jgi:hypothetical protein
MMLALMTRLTMVTVATIAAVTTAPRKNNTAPV